MLHIPDPVVPTRALHLLRRPLALGCGLHDLAEALRDGASRPWLFERPHARSILLTRAALTARARGSEVVIEAHTALGGRLLDALSWRFLPRQAGRTSTTLTLCFERSSEDDMAKRLHAPSAFDVLRALSTELSPVGGPARLLGLLAYDHVDLFEDIGPAAADPTTVPDFMFQLAEAAVVRDADGTFHAEVLADDLDLGERAADALAMRAEGASGLAPPLAPAPVRAVPDLSDAEFATLVSHCQEHVAAGDVFQIVPSRAWAAPCSDPFAAFRRLRALSPGPAHYHLETPAGTLFGASPETAVRVDAARLVEVSPIAGTRPRGRTAAEDAALAADLLADAKERAEHLMLVDLARNDVARVSATASRRVERLGELHRYSHVMHIVSKVTGRLRDGLDALHALQACMPLGTLSGAPKIEAMRLIRRYEGARRGAYGGAVVVLDGAGELDSAVVIRSAWVADGVAQARAGAGVVADSVPAAEAAETCVKARSVLRALGAIA